MGDSAAFDYLAALGEKRVDFAFIDGSHSYEYVKSDTVRVFELLAPGATVLWHDYQPFWTGVCQFLNELGEELPAQRIGGTTFAYYRRPF